MPRKHQRSWLAPGIFRDGDIITASVRVGSSRDANRSRKSQTFPGDTDVADVVQWQLDTRADLNRARPATAKRGTLAADVDDYLDTLPEGDYRESARAILRHWIVETSALHDMSRHAVERRHVLAQLSSWVSAGVAESTVNKRLTQLRKLYEALDGPTAPNPTDKIRYEREPEFEARDMSPRIIKLILDSIPDRGRPTRGQPRPTTSLTKIRLNVLAWSGIPGATLRRVRVRDIDFINERIYLRPRRKGKGVAAVWVRLLPSAVDALRAFVDAGLLGRQWSNSSMGDSWRTAIKNAKTTALRIADETGDESWADELANLPPNCRPYDLRHSFAAEVYRVTGDLRAVAELLQHASLETTKRYTKGAVSERVSAAIAKANETYGRIPAPPVLSPLRVVERRAS